MATKNKYRKGVLTSNFITLLLNSLELPHYDSESGKIYTKAVADVSKGVVDFGSFSARGQAT